VIPPPVRLQIDVSEAIARSGPMQVAIHRGTRGDRGGTIDRS
jgi:hypothetical protein